MVQFVQQLARLLLKLPWSASHCPLQDVPRKRKDRRFGSFLNFLQNSFEKTCKIPLWFSNQIPFSSIIFHINFPFPGGCLYLEIFYVFILKSSLIPFILLSTNLAFQVDATAVLPVDLKINNIYFIKIK